MSRTDRFDAAVVTFAALVLPFTACWFVEPPGWLLAVGTAPLAFLALVVVTASDTRPARRAAWLAVLLVLPAVAAPLACGMLPDAVLWPSTPHGPYGMSCMSGPGVALGVSGAVWTLAPRLDRVALGAGIAIWTLAALALLALVPIVVAEHSGFVTAMPW
ncbi:hypothetical protein [Sandaracinus amylolyticus]|uniref:Uncharacterized protein n=1 Tax=Sandaracinus amylolyticus TaxID=927083 RepID=A0A0F6YF80_9BACT|nr:hypothetical protein [Sandaracinus amylolyticus]AKF03282.1 hypothetical protein DB32_000431 [Sandaracinus amylolyticus]